MTVSSIQPRSFGKDLLTDKTHFGELTDSSGLLDHPQELKERLLHDGYLFLRGFFSRESVLQVRQSVIRKMRANRLVADSTDPFEAVALPSGRSRLLPQMAKEDQALQALLYGKRVHSFYASLLGGEVRHYDYTWFRAIGPGKGTAPHCDLVYMGRGTKQVFTLWVPYGDTSLELGGLSLLEKSHQKSAILRNYLSRDVDAYCSNQTGADTAKETDNFLWDGALSKNPVTLQAKLGGRWLTAEFRAGDVVTFGMTTVHGSLDNQTDRIRLSSDCRYQLASEAIDDRWVGTNPPGHSRAAKMGRVC